jgi:ATP-dependent Clp protease ATP-binding subunit ClpX
MTDKSDNSEEKVYCSFCGKSKEEVAKVIAGPAVFICDECVHLCDDIIKEEEKQTLSSEKKSSELPIPAKIRDYLDQYVIGQDAAKRTLAVAIYNHYKRINNLSEEGNCSISKSNILVIGSTGSGKTLLAETLASMLDVPFVQADATSLTQAGYVGEDVENILYKLFVNADNDVERMQKGIVYIDEVDKIAKAGQSTQITRDVTGEGVQQSLLKLIEGSDVEFPSGGGRKHPQQETVKVNTKNILFICGGAFVGLTDIIEGRVAKSSGIGFGAELKDSSDKRESRDYEFLSQVTDEDIIKYGIIPELKGRLPVTTTLAELDENMLVSVLTEPKNNLVNQYKSLLSMDSIELNFEKDSIRAIAAKAISNKTGARGLRTIMEKYLEDIMFDAPSLKDNGLTKIMITAKYIDSMNQDHVNFEYSDVKDDKESKDEDQVA